MDYNTLKTEIESVSTHDKIKDVWRENSSLQKDVS